MLDKPFESLQESDLERLVADEVEEGKTIDFKQALPQLNDEGRREFLADVSSFANTIGGHLLFGIKEKDGVATEICGVEDAAWDDTLQALDGSIRTAIAPRITCHLQTIRLASNKRVLVIKIDRSWNAPHRVTYRGHDKFYARGANGKYPLDVDQLRMAFAASSGIEERIREFRTERLTSIARNQMPIPMEGGGKVVLHLIPVSAMSPFAENRVAWITKPDPRLLPPPGATGWSHRRNYEGYLTFEGGRKGTSRSYVQLFHNGSIETVLSDVVRCPKDIGKNLLYTYYEHSLLESLHHLLEYQKNIGIELPIYLFVTLVDCRGAEMLVDRFIFDMEDYVPIDRDVLELPSSEIESFDVDAANTLRPMFDVVWQTCGFERSQNFGADGAWIRR